MTKKDYELLAGVLGGAYRNCEANREQTNGVGLVQVRLIAALEADNPKFNSQLFMMAVSVAAHNPAAKVKGQKGGAR